MAKSTAPKFLKLIAQALDDLSQQELESLMAGKGRLVYVAEAAEPKKTTIAPERVEYIITELAGCKSKEDVQRVLAQVTTKEELVAVAKAMKVHTVRNDRKDEIENKIMVFAIGGRLRSEAINNLNLGSVSLSDHKDEGPDTATSGE